MRKTDLLMYFLCYIFCFSAFERSKAASFDCNKASVDIEKIICANEYVSQLDEELGQAYKESLVKHKDKKNMIVRQQRNWLKWIRSQCNDPSCLSTLYETRIGEVIEGSNIITLDGANKTNFILTDGRGVAMCEDYLHILNSTPLADLRACRLPNLDRSKFKLVKFNLIGEDDLKIIDKMIYEKDGPFKADWEQVWPEREREYAMEYRQLSKANLDWDGNGQIDLLIKETFPYFSCSMFTGQHNRQISKKLENEWAMLPKENRLQNAKENGYKSFYRIIENENFQFVDIDNLITYEGEYFSIDQDALSIINTQNKWAEKRWVTIWDIDRSYDYKDRSYGMGSPVCKFWFNH